MELSDRRKEPEH